MDFRKSEAWSWKFVRASVRPCVRPSVRPSVRLSHFSEFLLLSCAKALQCLQRDNGSNSRVAG